MAKIIDFSECKAPIETRFEFKNGQRSRHGQYIPACRHRRFIVDESRREITCEECGELVDPFNIMLQFAYEERVFAIRLAKNQAALNEFEKIYEEWSLTIREKRRIEKAMREARLPLKRDE